MKRMFCYKTWKWKARFVTLIDEEVTVDSGKVNHWYKTAIYSSISCILLIPICLLFFPLILRHLLLSTNGARVLLFSPLRTHVTREMGLRVSSGATFLLSKRTKMDRLDPNIWSSTTNWAKRTLHEPIFLAGSLLAIHFLKRQQRDQRDDIKLLNDRKSVENFRSSWKRHPYQLRGKVINMVVNAPSVLRTIS